MHTDARSFDLILIKEERAIDRQRKPRDEAIFSNWKVKNTMGGGGGELRYEISQNAYIKLVLHSLKHKTSAVNGVFVGSSCDDGVQIIDSVPLFHNHLGLLPPLEISLIMVNN